MGLFEKLGGMPENPISSEISTQDKLQELRAMELPEIGAPPPDSTTEATFDARQVHDLAKTNLDFLAGLAIPAVFKYCYPPVFLSVWAWLVSYIHKPRDFSQLALGLPRGFGKTILIKLFILYCILFTSRKFILVLAENQTKANNILADIIDMLEEDNIKKVFGDWKLGIETDRQDLKKFGYRSRSIILMAGTVEVIRGITLKNERPDVMVFDDIQSRVVAESMIQSENLEREMLGTAMKAKSPHGCLFIFVANMYPTKWSILRRLKPNPNWIKFIAGGILADGTSLWPELQPIEQLIKEFENDLAAGRPEVFFSEVLNDENASANNHVDFSKIPAYTIPHDQIPAGNYIIIDPSGHKRNSDDTAIGYFEVHDGRPVLMGLISKRLSPGDTIRAALNFALTKNCRLVCIEAVAYQATLAYWFQFICSQLGIIGIEAVELHPGGHSKNSRILSMFKQYQAGETIVHPDVRPEVHLQISQFNPLKLDNTDDILDLLCYSHKVLELYGEYVVNYGVIAMQEHEAATVEEFNSPF
jgi:hypothetical protein